jgi:hypothetical protein
MTKHYILKITTWQAQAIVNACDLFSRIGIGQFQEIVHLARFGLIKPREGAIIDYDAYDHAERHINEAKRSLTGYESNASHGIHSERVPDVFKIAWDIQQVIRNRLAWDRAGNPANRDWKTMMGVDYDSPRPAAPPTPLATIESADDVTLLNELPEGYAIARAPCSAINDDAKWHLFDMASATPKWLASGESVRAMLEIARSSPSGRPGTHPATG